MAISMQQFAELRPYLYHLTAAGNLALIRSVRRLESAATLCSKGDGEDLLRERRTAHRVMRLEGTHLTLRDQAPLFEGNIEFEHGWDFQAFIALLNQRVFFWPGRERGPNDYGIRHYERYKNERPAVIRIPTNSLLKANQANPPFFCRFNSGSPRCSFGRKSPRGSRTFLTADCCDFSPGKAVEVTFIGGVNLPDDTQIRSGEWSRWERSFLETER